MTRQLMAFKGEVCRFRRWAGETRRPGAESLARRPVRRPKESPGVRTGARNNSPAAARARALARSAIPPCLVAGRSADAENTDSQCDHKSPIRLTMRRAVAIGLTW